MFIWKIDRLKADCSPLRTKYILNFNQVTLWNQAFVEELFQKGLESGIEIPRCDWSAQYWIMRQERLC